MKKTICLIPLLILIDGCSLLLSKVYGIKEIKTVDKNQCQKFISQIDFTNIDVHTFYIDSSSFDSYRKLPVSKKIVRDFSQPIQILFFDGDTLRSFHANCYAKGKSRDLNWNTNNRFEVFLPTSAISLDSAKFDIANINSKLSNVLVENQKRYTVIIIWTRMLEKISKSAIETVILNINRFNKNEVTTVYLLNNDEFYIGIN